MRWRNGVDYFDFAQRMPDERYISVDIESDGPIPGLYSMLSLGAVAIDDESQTFYVEFKPVTDDFDDEALRVSGLDRKELKLSGRSPEKGIMAFGNWVRKTSRKRSPVFVGFNAPFDWSFVNYYFIRYTGANPFGFSALDIKAYYMGAYSKRSWAETTKRNLDPAIRSTMPHTHNALDDALEQADIFRKIREQN
jgi:ribonuclease T